MACFINIAKDVSTKKTWLQFVIIQNHGMYIVLQIILTEIVHVTFVFGMIRRTQDNIIFDRSKNKLVFLICHFFMINDYVLIQYIMSTQPEQSVKNNNPSHKNKWFNLRSVWFGYTKTNDPNIFI